MYSLLVFLTHKKTEKFGYVQPVVFDFINKKTEKFGYVQHTVFLTS